MLRPCMTCVYFLLVVRLANSLVYQSKAVIDCNSLTQNLEMTCMFENRLGQNRSATVTINVIGGTYKLFSMSYQ